jgi:hypothetical protein
MPGVDVEELRVAVYWHFATTGQAPSIADLAEDLAVQPEQIRGGLRTLAAARHLALGPDDRILMAHPFSAVSLGFSVARARLDCHP